MARSHKTTGRKILNDLNVEPEWETHFQNHGYKLALIKTLNDYRRYDANTEVYKKWLSEYSNVIFGPQVAKQVMNIPDDSINETMSVLSRIATNGCQLDDPDIDRLEQYIDQVVVEDNQRKEDAKKQRTTTMTIRDRVVLASRELCGEIDHRVDAFIYDRGKEFDIYNWMKDNEMSGPHARYVLDHIRGYVKEFYEAVQGEGDVKEAYSCFSAYKLKKIHAFTLKLLSDGEKWLSSTTKTRKPRAKKATSKTKTVAKMNYKQRDDHWKRSSIDPTKIIGSSVLVVFNCRTKDVGFYFAAEGQTLDVKGSSIIGYDEDKSREFPLRSADVGPTLDNLERARIKRIQSIFVNDMVLTKAKPMSGRISKNTLLVQVA